MSAIWKKIYDRELSLIQSRHWSPGEVIATTQSLAEANDISYITARRILTELAKSGLVKNVPRVGCIIAEQKPKIYLLSPDTIPGSSIPLIIPLLLKGIFEEALKRHLDLIPIATDNLYHLDEPQPTVLIYITNMNRIDSNSMLELLPENIIPCGVHCPQTPVRGLGIGSDAENMMKLQVRTMTERSCRNIGYVGLTDDTWFQPRFQGFLKGMREHHLKLSLTNVLTVPPAKMDQFRKWYDEFQPDGICTPGINFADEIIRQLSDQEKEKTLIGSIGIPALKAPGYFYLQPDYYSEGTEIIRLIAEADFAQLKQNRPSYHLVSGNLHINQ